MFKTIKESSPAVLLLRIFIAALIVFGTYNPTGKSIYHWIANHPNPTDAWVVLALIVTLLLNIALLIAAWKSLGPWGTFLVLILFAALTYVTLQERWVGSSGISIQWLSLTLYSIYLGFGMAGAILWRRATGQVTVDDAEDVPT